MNKSKIKVELCIDESQLPPDQHDPIYSDSQLEQVKKAYNHDISLLSSIIEKQDIQITQGQRFRTNVFYIVGLLAICLAIIGWRLSQ